MGTNVDSEALFKSLTNMKTRYEVEQENLLKEYEESYKKMLEMKENNDYNDMMKGILDDLLSIDINTPLSQQDVDKLNTIQNQILDAQKTIEEALISTQKELNDLMGIQ